MIPDCEGWWRIKSKNGWEPAYVSADLTIPDGPHADPFPVSSFQWGGRLYAPDERGHKP